MTLRTVSAGATCSKKLFDEHLPQLGLKPSAWAVTAEPLGQATGKTCYIRFS